MVLATIVFVAAFYCFICRDMDTTFITADHILNVFRCRFSIISCLKYSVESQAEPEGQEKQDEFNDH